MASLSTLYLKAETLKTLLDTVNTKGDKGVEITISINDEMNKYDQNVSGYVSQTKEQREDKKPRFYVGNGKTYWSTNNDHPKSTKQNGSDAVPVEAEVIGSDLPW
jgi:hypothetical protein